MNNTPQDTFDSAPSPTQPQESVQRADTATQSEIKLWLGRIKRAKQKFDPDFKRMRRNMEFATGLQWQSQVEMDDERYTNNSVLGMVNQKVATLYAKNPTVEAKKRMRLEFQLWDGKMESLTDAMQQGQQVVMSGGELPPELGALFADYQTGKAKEKLLERVCETLKLNITYQMDSQRPEFKEQVKQAVRRVITCGVAYARPIFIREGERVQPNSTDSGSTVTDRLVRLKGIVTRLEEGKIDETNSELATLRSLALSLGASSQDYEPTRLDERVEFDFPPSTSIIPDSNCRTLKEWVSARWIAQEYNLPVDDVNAIFGTDIQTGSGPGAASEFKEPQDLTKGAADYGDKQSDPYQKQLVSLYEVFDYHTKTRRFVCDGCDQYILEPEPVLPVSGFWHHFALTFNDVEVEQGQKGSIYPPSDVQLLKSPQKAWNRTREALRDQRNANAPKYLVRKGLLTEADKNNLRNALPNSVIELEGIPPEMEPAKAVQVMQVAAIDPAVYDTRPLSEDMMRSAGMQDANVGPAQPNVTATVGTIAEQSRLTVSASNIDDLDGWLSRFLHCAGEFVLREMSEEVVKRAVGPGAVWPTVTREDYLNEVYLTIKAASSGRPNKAISIANFQQMAPILLQAGANPIAVIEEGIKRLDDDLDVTKFFPIGIPAGLGGSAGQPSGPQSAQSMQQPGMGPQVSGSHPGNLSAPESAVGRMSGLPSRVDVPVLQQQ